MEKNNLYEKLKNPKYIMAPMVDQSDLPFRILSRKYGCELCYSPMLHSRLMVEDKKYLENHFKTNNIDRPLIVQLCGNDSSIMIKAANLIKDKCDAIDINLGCPQNIAKRGNYGSFLLENEKLVIQIVKDLTKNLDIPITCKIRIFPDKERTLNLAKNLEDAGCSILTVHGRTKEQNKHLVGKCDWDIIKEIKDNLKIPIFSNGGIHHFKDIKNCLKYTNVDGIMSAEALLENPALFTEELQDLDDLALEYLECFKKYPSNRNYIKPHLFKILYKGLTENTDLRDRLGKSKEFEEMRNIVLELKERRKDIKKEEKFGWYERYNNFNLPKKNLKNIKKN